MYDILSPAEEDSDSGADGEADEEDNNGTIVLILI